MIIKQTRYRKQFIKFCLKNGDWAKLTAVPTRIARQCCQLKGPSASAREILIFKIRKRMAHKTDRYKLSHCDRPVWLLKEFDSSETHFPIIKRSWAVLEGARRTKERLEMKNKDFRHNVISVKRRINPLFLHMKLLILNTLKIQNNEADVIHKKESCIKTSFQPLL